MVRMEEEIKMVTVNEKIKCTSLRVFLWNEKFTRNQISESEGLCVFIIRSKYMRLHPCTSCPHECNMFLERSCTTTIPFDVSMLLNKDISLGPILMAATLQFLPSTVKEYGNDISNYLFSKFQFSQILLPTPRPTYVIAIEFTQTRHIDYAPHVPLQDIPGVPPPILSVCRFKKDRNEYEEILRAARSNMSRTDDMNDPYHRDEGDVREYIFALRDYIGEAGFCPINPPIMADVPRGLVAVDRCTDRVPQPRGNCRKRVLMGNACPVCFEEFKDKSEVTTTYCLHDFHTRCLLTWLRRNNTCPTCRAGYPLHYSPFFNTKRRKLEA